MTNIKEIWKDIIGYNGVYQISSLGNVLSHRYYGRQKTSLLKPGWCSNKKYLFVVLYKGKTKKHHRVHQLVASHFLEKKDGLVVNHKDGNSLNNNITNLEYCTTKENNHHAMKLGLWKPHLGEKHGGHKLKNEDVLNIREMYKTGKYTSRDIAKMYNLKTKTTILNILNNKSWSHI